MRQYRNILVIQTAFIGDAILASSLVEKIHETLPAAAISILVRKGNEQVFLGHPFLRETLVWDKSKKKMGNLFWLVRVVRRRRFDCVVNCHRYLSSGIVAAFSGAGHIAGYKENPLSFMFNTTVRHRIGDGTHEIERYQLLVRDFLPGHAAKPRLYPTAADELKVATLKGTRYVCMAPASVWFTKQMPLEKWISLCDSMDGGTTVYLLGAPNDHPLAERIVSATAHRRVVNLAGKLSLLESAALMSSAHMNYVNDSAPLHLASSTNAPVTAFFASTVPEFGFGPLSDVSRVFGVEDLPCRPCGLHGYKKCPLGHFKCGHLMPLPPPEQPPV